MQLASFLDALDICHEHRILSKHQVYEHLVDRICAHHHLPISGKGLLDLILRRDEESTTAYSTGIAIPHIRMEGFQDTVVAMTFLQNPLVFDGITVSWVVLIITDKSSSNIYLNIVAALLKLSKDAPAMSALSSTTDGHGVIHLLKKMNIAIKKDVCIADVMIQNPVSINPTSTLKELNILMSLHQVAGLPVVGEGNKYLGEVNILDVLKVGIPEYLMMLDNLNFLTSFEPLEKLFDKQDVIKVSDIMVTDGVFLRPEASVIEAVFEMISHHKRYMSVVKDGALVGVVTAMDILRKVITA
ncbi:MAG: PTS sugar transporter subunit IIA [Candidatus Cloacimonetes bacterium]|nr:PTS sugar transporter subunit IIA [Candidatus Cloacimonadota bacterium]